MAQETSDKSPNSQLEWTSVREEPYVMMVPESTKDKFIRKVQENPFVPIGCLATVGALSYGLYNFYKGRTQMSQYMMRARVIFQGLTLVAITVGFARAVNKKQTNANMKE